VTAGDNVTRGFGLLPPPRAARGDSRSGTAPRRVRPTMPPRPAHAQDAILDQDAHESAAPLEAPLPAPPDEPRDRLDARMRRLGDLPYGSPARRDLRQQIVESQLPLVHHLAQRFRGRGEPYDDLVQVGTIGLLHAVDRFDPGRGAFAAFAVPTILGEIRRHFRDRGWAMRVPRRLQDFGRQVSVAREQLTQRLGRSPTVLELAQELHDDPDLVVEAIETATAFATVPLPSASEEVLFDSLSSPDYGLERVEQRATLRPLLARLPTRERKILALRFIRGLSQSQIAAEVGVSQMHVSRLLARSLSTLREGLTEDA
jgi:RNA polymerase sigma-B factor